MIEDLNDLTEKLKLGNELSSNEVRIGARVLASGKIDDSDAGDFLIAFADKGETPREVASFAATFRELAIDPGLTEFAERALDIVGTGGDHSGSFNISTTTAFVLAAGGIPVLKHGNRSITSKSGSADFLTALGIEIEAEPEKIRQSAKELNFCYFYAPAFHPAFKAIMPVRRKLAAERRRTIFNILGPLINPSCPARQMTGVFAAKWVKPLAEAHESLGLRSGVVVHGELPNGKGMDELSCVGQNRVAGFGELRDLDGYWSPESKGFTRCSVTDLAGGDSKENAALLKRILDGSGPSGLIDTIVLNAGTAFLVVGQKDGFEIARELLLGGSVKVWLEQARDFYAR